VGAGRTTTFITMDPASFENIFHILSQATISGVTIRKEPNAAAVGVGIFVAQGASLVLEASTVRDIPSAAIHNQGTVTLNGSTLLANLGIAPNSTAANIGGGIQNDSMGTLIVQNSVLNGNTRVGEGGNIFNEGTATITDSTIANGRADPFCFFEPCMLHEQVSGSGGGISNHGTMTLENSTVSGNQAREQGGGIFNRGNLTLVNSTVSGNTAADQFAASRGGGIASVDSGAVVKLFNVTVTDNQAERAGGIAHLSGQFQMANTILGGNFDTDPGNGAHPDCEGSLESLGFNLISISSCSILGSNTNIVGVQPKLGVLKKNGGPTQTHMPGANSAVTDAGDPTGCDNPHGAPLAVDQRGFNRHVDGNLDGTIRCDIGAVEFDPAVGIGSLLPRKGTSTAGEQVTFDLDWVSPTRWRDLKSLDLRFIKRGKVILWLRFVEGLPTSRFQFLDPQGNVLKSGDAGENRLLNNNFAALDLAQSGFTASGPDDPHVVVHFALKFKPDARGKLKIEIAGEDDFGNVQAPQQVARRHIQ
jgi:hypothetical protein